MNIRNILLSTIFILFFISALAQNNNNEKSVKKFLAEGVAKTACDCNDAVKINITKITSYGLTKPPIGFGSVQEITSKNKTDKFNFETEHNTAWYLLNINFDGKFVFEITPQDTANDYDFLLYKYTDTNFCSALQKKELKPIRSNLSRAKPQTGGVTGLLSEAKNEFVGQGNGDAYSKAIEVVKGEKYILVLDNVYPDGRGHTIKFNYIKKVTISGIVIDADSIPVKAEVSLTDNKGTIVKQINTGDDGKYIINTGIKEEVNYSIVFSSDISFIAIKTINTKDLKKPNEFIDIRTILIKLKKGTTYKINNINFYGNQEVLLPESYPSVEALCKLMKKNNKMVIRIEGHVNGTGQTASEQTLSEWRAKTVYNYLIKNGIEKERMSTIGYAANNMLYPHTSNEIQASANRRVEINVISIK